MYFNNFPFFKDIYKQYIYILVWSENKYIST